LNTGAIKDAVVEFLRGMSPIVGVKPDTVKVMLVDMAARRRREINSADLPQKEIAIEVCFFWGRGGERERGRTHTAH
jgi:hypothetical protein